MNQIEYDRLTEIRQEMRDLLDEANQIIRSEDRTIHQRARAYWIGAIDVGLGDGEFVDTHSHTFLKTLKEISVDSEEEETSEEDEQDE